MAGSDDDKRRAFAKAFAEMSRRIALFVNLPLAKLDAMAIKHALDRIGELRGELYENPSVQP